MSERNGSFPADWKELRIAQLTVRTRQRDPRRTPTEPFHYIDVSSVSNRSFRIIKSAELIGADAPSRARKEIQTDDVLFATVRPTLKRVALVPADLDRQIASTGFIVLRPDRSRVLPRYLYSRLLTDDFMKRMEELERGASYPAVRDSDVLKEIIPVPPLAEQRKIVGVLGLVQQAIEQEDRLLELTSELKNSLVDQLFTYGLGKEAQKQTEVGPIPRSWKVVRCVDVCELITVGVVVRPASHYVPAGVPAFRSLNIREDRLETDHLVYFSQSDNDTLLAKSKLRQGDVLVVRTGYPGTSCVVPPEFDGANCIDLVILRAKNNLLSSGFLSRFFNSPSGKRQARAGKHGLAQQHLNVGAVKRMLVPIPSLEEQNEIDSALSTIQQKLEFHRRKHSALSVLFNTLLHQLMTAQIRISNLERTELKGTV